MRANIRRRTAWRWAVAGPAVVAVTMSVAGCGQVKLGAVALYGDQRITSVKLADEVANLNTGYQADKGKVQIPYKPPAMSRQVLSWLLRFATTEKVASREGIKVTPAMAQAQLHALALRAKGSGLTLSKVAVLSGLPPDQLQELGRWLAIQAQVTKKFDLGVPPKTSAANKRLGKRIGLAQCLAAKSLHISINPQYGAYNYAKTTVVPAVTMLSAVPGTPAKAPGGRTPKC